MTNLIAGDELECVCSIIDLGYCFLFQNVDLSLKLKLFLPTIFNEASFFSYIVHDLKMN